MASVDEETPLLNAKNKIQPTPLPRLQFSILLFLQLAEPLTSNVISPFAPQLIRDLDIAHGNESHVGHYVGLLSSMFFVAEGFTVLYWSRTSDQIGRRPVIMSGLLGLSIAMYCFGLSKTFLGLLFSRSLSGALNGNVGVLKSMVAEMTDSTNISRAYAYMPLAWNTGGTLGPIIGGWLYRPAERFPNLFGNSEFLKTHPYFLPCAVPATFSIIACAVTFFFLKETLPSPIPISHYLGLSRSSDGIATPPFTSAKITQKVPKIHQQLPLRRVLTRRVIVSSGNYASLAIVDIAFRSIQPLFYSTPIHLGGLGLPTPIIGNILAGFGVLNGLSQAFFFARINDRWGPKTIFMWSLGSAIPAIAMFPILSYLAKNDELGSLLWIGIASQVILSVGLCFGFGSVFIFISNAAPNRASIGATNGISQTSVSVVRAIGPAVASSLFSLSIEKGYVGGNLVYCALTALVGVALYIGTFLPHRVWDLD